MDTPSLASPNPGRAASYGVASFHRPLRPARDPRIPRTDLSNLAEALAVHARDDEDLPAPFKNADIAEFLDRVGVELHSGAGPVDGQYWRGPSRHVRLRQDMTPKRRIFVLAHELGHLFLERARVDKGFRSGLHPGSLQLLSLIDIGGTSEERLCDAFARSLLLPSPEMVALVGHQQVVFNTIRHLSEYWGVSAALVSSRLFDLGLSNGMYLRGHIGDEGSLVVEAWTWRGLAMSEPRRLEVLGREALTVGDHDVEGRLAARDSVRVSAQVRVRANGRATAFLSPKSERLSFAARVRRTTLGKRFRGRTADPESTATVGGQSAGTATNR